MRAISTEHGLEVDPDAIIEEIPVGLQQRVEIIKVLFRSANAIIFDEPTAVLTPQEVEEFFGIVRSLREAGKALVFITHKLGEVLEVADRISVLRGGKIVGEGDPKTATERRPRRDDGRPAGALRGREADDASRGGPLLEVKGPDGAQRARRGRGRRRRSSPSTRARSSASPASRATARPNWSRR